jgi:hypothetical protein
VPPSYTARKGSQSDTAHVRRSLVLPPNQPRNFYPISSYGICHGMVPSSSSRPDVEAEHPEFRYIPTDGFGKSKSFESFGNMTFLICHFPKYFVSITKLRRLLRVSQPLRPGEGVLKVLPTKDERWGVNNYRNMKGVEIQGVQHHLSKHCYLACTY